jgi:hypothetical protein
LSCPTVIRLTLGPGDPFMASTPRDMPATQRKGCSTARAVHSSPWLSTTHSRAVPWRAWHFVEQSASVTHGRRRAYDARHDMNHWPSRRWRHGGNTSSSDPRTRAAAAMARHRGRGLLSSGRDEMRHVTAEIQAG